MKPFIIRQFANACGGIWHGPSEMLTQQIGGVVIDSRQVKEGDLFLAVVGERADGHRFIPEVFRKGAVCAVSQQELSNPPGPYLFVRDTLKALRDAAEAYRRTFDIPVVGVTGSVGKTSTKEMIASILGQRYRTLKTSGNFNNEIGVPLTIFQIDACHEAAVLEMGMNHFGEMHRLSKMARPTHCVFTNIGVAHLEFLGSRDGILKAKCEMLDYAAPDAAVFVNGDDDKLTALKDRAVTFGLSPSCQIFADHLEDLGLDGIRCRIHAREEQMDVTIPMPGSHMVYNAMAGTCVGLSLGLSMDEIRRGIEALQPVSGRSHVVRTPLYTLLDDCYNANPVSMCAMLDVLANTPGRRIAILGDMGELGEESEKLHTQVGEHAASLNLDAVITIGALSRAIHEAAGASAALCRHFDSKEAFLAEADQLLQKEDSILIKASHYMGFEHLVHTLAEKK